MSVSNVCMCVLLFVCVWLCVGSFANKYLLKYPPQPNLHRVAQISAESMFNFAFKKVRNIATVMSLASLTSLG